jgi:hypothetical protein
MFDIQKSLSGPLYMPDWQCVSRLLACSLNPDYALAVSHSQAVHFSSVGSLTHPDDALVTSHSQLVCVLIFWLA